MRSCCCRLWAIVAVVMGLGKWDGAGVALGQDENRHPPPQLIVPPIPPRWIPGRPVPVNLTAVDASITITDQIATTVLDLSLTNPSNMAQEAQLVLPVPEGVAVKSLQWDGTGSEPRAEVLPRDEARRIYEEIVRGSRDPALVEFVGMNMIRSSVFPVPPHATQHLRLTYEQMLTRDGKRLDYAMVRSEALGAGDVRWTISADIRAGEGVAGVYSSSHDIATERVGPGHVKVRLAGSSEQVRSGSFRLSVLLAGGGDALTGTAFLYPDSQQAGTGYFLLVFAPQARGEDKAPPARREVVLVLDRSGSMRGEKFDQARKAAEMVIRGLRDGESFNIIAFSDSITGFSPRPVSRSDETVRAAERFLWGLTADGGTNIHDALMEAVRASVSEGSVPLVLFLTDGMPTVGERREGVIRKAVKEANASRRRLFSFGVGYDVNAPLLAALSAASRGAATIVMPQEDVEVRVSQVFRRLDGPVVTSPTLTVFDAAGSPSTAIVRDVVPQELPDVFEGDQVVLVGRYVSDRPFRVRVEGESGTAKRAVEVMIDPSQATMRNDYVGRLWALRRVMVLVDEIRQAGADGGTPDAGRMKELTDEIVRLSVRWGILTEYTAFLAREETDFRAGLPALGAPAMENLERRAILDRAGAGGVAQQMDIATKQQAVNTAGAGRYYAAVPGHAGAPVEVRQVGESGVRFVGGRAFFNRKGRWVDAMLLEQEDAAPDRTVEVGSEAYFALVTELMRMGQQAMLAQDGDIYVGVGKERVLVRGK
jgi:Ca-activated chloride channel family protein